MAAKQCPNCSKWLTEDEALSGQCPGCRTFLESEIPASSTPSFTTTPLSNAPVIRTYSSPSPSERVKKSSGIWSSWWIILLAFVGMRACHAVVETQKESSRPTYEQYEFDPAPIDLGELDPEQAELLRRLLEDRPMEDTEFNVEPDWQTDSGDASFPEFPTPSDPDVQR